MEGLQKWRVRGGIWRGLKMEGHLEVLLELCFFTKPLKFGVETYIEAPTGVALVKQLPNPEPDGSHRVLIHEMIPGRQTIIRPPLWLPRIARTDQS
jgi:hypothetical protein